MVYLIIGLVVAIVALIAGAFLMGRKDESARISRSTIEAAKKSQADYTELEKLSDQEIKARIKNKMVKKK